MELRGALVGHTLSPADVYRCSKMDVLIICFKMEQAGELLGDECGKGDKWKRYQWKNPGEVRTGSVSLSYSSQLSSGGGILRRYDI